MGTARIFTAIRRGTLKKAIMRVAPLGDSALMVELGETIGEATHARVQAALHLLEAEPLPAVIELVPAFTTVTLFYDALRAVRSGAPADNVPGWLEAMVRRRLARLSANPAVKRGRSIEIPVCYDPDFAPDLPEIAAHAGLTTGETARRHHSAEFLVHLLGFAPGFPYMAGTPPELSLPRRATPRVSVPAGTVGIIGTLCCIYPVETPGGWNLIGRTPQRLFNPGENPPAFLQPGDRVKFRPVGREEFDRLYTP
jgi:inhibitor of KinA